MNRKEYGRRFPLKPIEKAEPDCRPIWIDTTQTYGRFGSSSANTTSQGSYTLLLRQAS